MMIGSNCYRPFGARENFTASITGDPHYAVSGSINGQSVDSTFDNQDLGGRTQYRGAGFALKTDTTPWGDNGAAVVDSATVATGFGRNKDFVTISNDGSVLVDGQAQSMQAGQSIALNGTSSLTCNPDGTYTVSSRNGKVANTIGVNQDPNGNYLNINASVSNVQTAGWLQRQA
jgi:hypothetical protein